MSKLEKLCEAYEAFERAISDIPDVKVSKLCGPVGGIRKFVADARARTPRPTPSQIAAGLEQGWRETPSLIQGVEAQWRPILTKAWHDATRSAYPDFLANERQRLEKVIERGKIRTEAEFYRIRHEVDLLEGEADSTVQLNRLYALIDAYEAR